MQLARLMLRRHHAERAEHREQRSRTTFGRTIAQASVRSATRIIALRARGLAAISAALARIGLPTERSCGAGQSAAAQRQARGSGGGRRLPHA